MLLKKCLPFIPFVIGCVSFVGASTILNAESSNASVLNDLQGIKNAQTDDDAEDPMALFLEECQTQLNLFKSLNRSHTLFQRDPVFASIIKRASLILEQLSQKHPLSLENFTSEEYLLMGECRGLINSLWKILKHKKRRPMYHSASHTRSRIYAPSKSQMATTPPINIKDPKPGPLALDEAINNQKNMQLIRSSQEKLHKNHFKGASMKKKTPFSENIALEQ